VQNLFCVFLECKIYFAFFWSAKFILRLFGVQNLFCVFLECKIYFASFWSAKFILRRDFVPNFLAFRDIECCINGFEDMHFPSTIGSDENINAGR